MQCLEKEQDSFLQLKKKKLKRPSINIESTQYEIIEEIGKKHFNWRIRKIEDENDDSDIIWVDCGIQPEKLCKMKPYQKINHFPGMHEIARKNYLAKNLNKMQRLYPNQYNFFPKTWLYPAEFPTLKYSNFSNKVYIVKPEASSQGKGIFLTKTLEGFEENERYVIQEYIKNPMLIEGLKFDMRIYVLVAGCDPLKIFIHKEGLGRFATEPYITPNLKNLDNQCMHLTNYAINKTSENFIFNSDPNADNVGHKRSLTATFEKIKEMGFNTEKIWSEINSIIVKTLITAQPSLAHIYRASQPDDPYNGMCFELLGFDILLDDIGKPWLLEVNHSPSFNIDSPIDKKIKFQVISEALILLNITRDNRKEYDERKKKQILFRSLSHNKEQEKERKKNDFINAQAKRSRWESNHLGNFLQVFPCDNTEYDSFVQAAMKIWLDSTGGKPALSKEPRPQTQENLHKIKNSNKRNSPDILQKNDLAVFQRLYQVKKVKLEQVPIPPCIQLDDAFKIQFLKSQTPYGFVELIIPAKIEKIRYKSIPKKRISNYSHHLDEILKEKRAIEGVKRTFNIYEAPLHISSVLSEDINQNDTNKAKCLKNLVLKKII